MSNTTVFNVEDDYKSFEVDDVVYDKQDIFQSMIEKYINNGRLSATNYALIGEMYQSVTKYVNSTYAQQK